MNDWEKELQEQMTIYSREIADNVDKKAKQKASELSRALREDSPEKTGEYKKGWQSKLMYKSATGSRYKVRNVKKAQLTHLLEYGHINAKTGKRVKAIPHIKKNADKIISEFERDVESILKGAGK